MNFLDANNPFLPSSKEGLISTSYNTDWTACIFLISAFPLLIYLDVYSGALSYGSKNCEYFEAGKEYLESLLRGTKYKLT